MVRVKPYTNDIYNAGRLPYTNDIYKSADGEYNVNIIHINCSHTAISIVEPQDDADTFINSCGETGERPAIRVMIIINDVWATAKVNDDIDKNVTLDICYTDDGDDNNINIYDIVLAIVKPKIDAIKTNVTLDVLHGLNRFVADNGLRVNAYIDVITAATDRAKEEGLSLTEYLIRYSNKD